MRGRGEEIKSRKHNRDEVAREPWLTENRLKNEMRGKKKKKMRMRMRMRNEEMREMQEKKQDIRKKFDRKIAAGNESH